MNPYSYLIVAIISEVIATTALKASASFTRPLPSLLVVMGYSFGGYYAGRVAAFEKRYAAGVAFAALSGIACIHFLIRFIERIGLLPFTVYRLILAGVIVWHVA